MVYFSKEDQLWRKLVLIDEGLLQYEETRVSRRAPIYMEWLTHKLKILWALGSEEKAIELLRAGKERFKDHWRMANRYSGELIDLP